MRPARMPSARVKLVPWYYAERNQPSRMIDTARAIAAEYVASESPDADELWRHKDCVIGECSQAARKRA